MKHYFVPYLNPVFIESGSYGGGGIMAALNAGFKKIISIELSEYYYDYCTKLFETEKERVTIIRGDSILMLPKILETINERCTFWLDGHYMKEKYISTGIMEVPLMEELKIIAKHHIKNHTILIDDMRLIKDKTSEWKSFPYCICDIEEIIYSINPEYKITYDVGQVADDVLIAQV
jgi:hypothetical protein